MRRMREIKVRQWIVARTWISLLETRHAFFKDMCICLSVVHR
nr:hypothetical protein [Tanacetum cinerariifolium]